MGSVRAYFLFGSYDGKAKVVPYLGPNCTAEPEELFIAPREKQVPTGLSRRVEEHGFVLKRFDMNRALATKGEVMRKYLREYAEEVLKDAKVELNLDSIFAVVEPNGKTQNKQLRPSLVEQIST